jgi:hypothetical protein
VLCIHVSHATLRNSCFFSLLLAVLGCLQRRRRKEDCYDTAHPHLRKVQRGIWMDLVAGTSTSGASDSAPPKPVSGKKLTRGQAILQSHRPPSPLISKVPLALTKEHVVGSAADRHTRPSIIRQHQIVQSLAAAVAEDLLSCSDAKLKAAPTCLSRVFLTRDDLKRNPPKEVHSRTRR